MANPPVNRRPGVDASIVQADWVRGYDGPQVTDDPCDIILSNGANAVDGRVSDLFVWNRTDARDQPMFIFAVGADFTTLTAQMGVYAGLVGDPNGIITDGIGSLYISNNPAAIWQNQDGADTWKKVSDDSGGENLEETLAIGNFTGDRSIIITDGANAFIIGEENTTGGDGAPVRIYGGTASDVTGDGGAVWVTSGVTTGGNTGEVRIASADILAGTGNVGPVRLFGGTTTGGGDGGNISATAGNGAQGGEVLLQGGDGANVGGDRGGRLQFLAGNSPADGDGGAVNIASGSPGTPIAFTNGFVAGRAGGINLLAGNSASTQEGGNVFLRGGQGGTAGGVGGSILLAAGLGGGGAADGIVLADGIFAADNYLRGDGDPNVLGKIAPEGSIYQRSTAGVGQAWVNVNGTSTGWSQLLGAGGGIVSALTQIQWGSLQASSDGLNDELAADGTFYATVGAGPQQLVYQVNSKSNTQGPDNTPAMTLGAAAGGEGGVYLDTHLSRNSRARITFKISINQTDADTRFFFGFTQSLFGNTAIEQLEQDSPPGNWFGIQKGTGDTAWRFRAQFGASTDNVASAITVTDGATYYFAFDLFEDAEGGVSVAILDEEFTQVASHTYSTAALISNAGFLRPLGGVGSAAANKSVFLHNIAVVSRIDLAEKAFAGGMAGFSPPLSQVLIAGNETGGTGIIVNHNDTIEGKSDDDGIDGAALVVRSGSTTNLAGNSGLARFQSNDIQVAGGSGSTGNSLFSSGVLADVTNTTSGNTGTVQLVSGSSFGASGNTGEVFIGSGAFVFGGGGPLATTGDITIAVGGSAFSDAVPGTLTLEGGDTSLNGVQGGNIDITSGGNTTNGNSGDLTFSTAAAGSPDGGTGNIVIAAGLAGTNSGNGGSVTISGGFGRSAGAASGNLALGAGFAFPGSGADGGDVGIVSGNSELAQGGDIQFTTGDSTVGGFRGGDFVFNPGVGPGGAGTVVINGKLTVTGLIDPTGLVLTGQALVPTVVSPGDGLLWVDNNGANTILNYTDDANVTIQLGAGGGGAGTLEATLALGNETGNKALLISDGDQAGIIGQDSAVTDGGNILVTAGSSLAGGGGIGGRFQVTTGAPDPTGNGDGGLLRLLTSGGAGTGDGGLFDISTGDGGATDGWGGHFNALLGEGQGAGDGGSFLLEAGDGGATGGGGNIVLTPGTGNGGGTDGIVQVTGNQHITGDLQVDGVIDPLGIGFVAQGANPIPLPGGGTPLAGSIWTNLAGELIFTNIGVGDLNISTSIATGVGSLSATLGVGSTTGANGIEFSLTSPGISGADNAGGDGGNIVLAAGSSTGGGDGGGLSFQAGSPDVDGDGGDIIATTTPGNGVGRGGGFSFTSGPGGSDGGNGGGWSATMGLGGDSVNAQGGSGGNWGAFAGSGGAGGLGVGSLGGAGGLITLVGGTGGTGQAGSGVGGNVLIGAGKGGDTADGGDLTLLGGESGDTSGDPGTLLIQGGDRTTGATLPAGEVLIQGGANGAGATTIVGGRVGISGGDLAAPPSIPLSLVAGRGGDVDLRAGSSAGLVAGGDLLMRGGVGGDAAAGGAVGGNATLEGGDAATGSDGDGGLARVLGGKGDGTGDGGVVLLQGGDPLGVGGYGGVNILAGGTTPLTTDPGDIQLIASASATGTGSGYFTVTGGDSGKPGFVIGVGGDGAVGTGNPGGDAVFGGGAGEGVGGGGGMSLRAGAGGGTGPGGRGELRAGNAGGGNNNGGDLDLFSGVGAGTSDGGNVTIASGSGGNVSGDGGKGSFKAGNAGAGNGSGGLIEIIAGTGTGTGLGGNVLVQSGAGAGFAEKGSIHLLAEGGTAVGTPGSVEGVAASPPAIGNGGNFRLTAAGGAAAGAANISGGDGLLGAGVVGGSAGIFGGVGGQGGTAGVTGGNAEVGAAGAGGQARVKAGNGDGVGVGGELILAAGAGGTPGQITLGETFSGDTLNADAPAMKLGVAVGLGGSSPVTWAGLGLTAFTAAPRIIQLTMAAPPASIPVGGTSVYVDTTVAPTAAGFSVGFTVAPIGPVDVHIVAYL